MSQPPKHSCASKLRSVRDVNRGREGGGEGAGSPSLVSKHARTPSFKRSPATMRCPYDTTTSFPSKGKVEEIQEEGMIEALGSSGVQR